MKRFLPVGCLVLTIGGMSLFFAFDIGPKAGIEFCIYAVFFVFLALVACAVFISFCRCIEWATASPNSKPAEGDGSSVGNGAPRRKETHWITFAVLWLTVVGVFVLYPAMPWTVLRTDYRLRLACGNKLRSIALAMDAYHTRYGDFPPSYISDKNGRPCLSWRILLLPYFFENYDEIYRQIRLDEPWNSPHNRKLLASDENLAYLFRCPAAPPGGESSNDTNYLMVLRAGHQNNGKSGTAAAHTIVIVEVRQSGINWAEPRDVDLGEISGQFNEPGRLGIGSYHRGLAHFLLRNGDVSYFLFTMSPEQVRKLLDGSVDPATLDIEYSGDHGKR